MAIFNWPKSTIWRSQVGTVVLAQNSNIMDIEAGGEPLLWASISHTAMSLHWRLSQFVSCCDKHSNQKQSRKECNFVVRILVLLKTRLP